MNIAVVVGVGPGIGSAVAHKFAQENFIVILISRNMNNLTPVKDSIESKGGKAFCYPTDASSETSVKETFSKIRENHGNPSVLIYNAAARRFKKQTLLETSTEEFTNFWKINTLGAFLCCKEVVENMIKEKKGTILFTGATSSIRGSEGLTSFSVGKFGLRSLAGSLARELWPKGIHVAHIIIDGVVDKEMIRKFAKKFNKMEENFFMKPERIANEYWNLHSQHETTWTLEMDLRPNITNIYSSL
jgi:short-subunit dehydrogenase